MLPVCKVTDRFEETMMMIISHSQKEFIRIDRYLQEHVHVSIKVSVILPQAHVFAHPVILDNNVND